MCPLYVSQLFRVSKFWREGSKKPLPAYAEFQKKAELTLVAPRFFEKHLLAFRYELHVYFYLVTLCFQGFQVLVWYPLLVLQLKLDLLEHHADL